MLLQLARRSLFSPVPNHLILEHGRRMPRLCLINSAKLGVFGQEVDFLGKVPSRQMNLLGAFGLVLARYSGQFGTAQGLLRLCQGSAGTSPMCGVAPLPPARSPRAWQFDAGRVGTRSMATAASQTFTQTDVENTLAAPANVPPFSRCAGRVSAT